MVLLPRCRCSSVLLRAAVLCELHPGAADQRAVQLLNCVCYHTSTHSCWLQVQDSNRSTATQASSQQPSSLENALSLESTPSIIQDRQ